MNNKKIYIAAILAITAANFSFAQIRTVNSDTVGNAPNSSAFIDVTSNPAINGNPNLGKGLLFPQTDLSLFTTFGGAPFGLPTNYATYYDGMIVYNTKDGGKAGVGTTQGELKPGFWYYENKSKNVNGGTWKQISSPTTNQLTLTGNSLISTVNGVASNSITLPVGNNVSASNGLYKAGDNIKLGGTLTEQTTITTNGNNRLFIKGSENNAINFDDNTFSVDAQNNRVGIGTNTPTQKLDVKGSAIISDKLSVGSDWRGAALAVDNKKASEPIVAFSGTGSQRRFTVLDDGNVGIGTDDPTQKLDIDGALRIRGTKQMALGDNDRILAIEPNGYVKSVTAAEVLNNLPRFINAGNFQGNRIIAEGATNLIDGTSITVTVPANATYKVVISGNVIAQHPAKVANGNLDRFTFGAGEFQLRVNGSTVSTRGSGFFTIYAPEMNPNIWKSGHNAATLNHVVEIPNNTGSPISRTINVHYKAINTSTGLANKNHQAFFDGTFQTYRMP
ncbi:hypothetical protein [Chryseobacterium sp. Mn2064]|uniref:hypothetical protein n=1 Tax=Chryseobacterium sp. Mn2064 TaxID=3395263 RepID=UPI003BC2422B